MSDMHTPRPWKTRLSRDGSGDVGITADGLPNVLAEVFGDIHYAGECNQAIATANAELIVTAVNERPALLARASQDAETIKALEAKLTAIRNKIPMNYLRRHDVDGATGPTSECDIVAAMADYSADRWKYIDRVAAAEKSAKAMREALDECEAYFDNRSDVSDGDYGIPEPNEEMRLLSTVRAALAGRAS